MTVTNKETHIITMEDILSLYNDKIRYIKLAYSFVGDYSIAEDIFSESILKFMDKKEELHVANLRMFFLSTIKNRCLDYLDSCACRATRQEHRLQDDNAIIRHDISILSSGESEKSATLNIDVPKLIEKCRRQLPQLSFEVFLAKRLEGMSYRQISKMYGISERRINFEISKAQKIFRKEFKDYRIFTIVFILHILPLLSGKNTDIPARKVHYDNPVAFNMTMMD